MDQDHVVEQVFNMIRLQQFADWYNEDGNFDKWIRGDEDAPPVDQVKQELKSMIFGRQNGRNTSKANS